MTLDKLKAEVRKKRAMPININISELLRSALLVTCTVLLVLIHCQVQNIAHSFNSCDTDLYEDSPILERTP
jgi:hypothetical protein